ncbi:MAG: S8 family serine peptidase [Chitinophagaceae bacterium]|nr:S8 family serine peptidase [Chitinophagaceae bacterium]
MRSLLASVFLFFLVKSFAQLNATKENLPKNWYLLDKNWDGVYGISLSDAYNFVKDKNSEPVVVAIISGGIDTSHEDLCESLWRNPGEIPGNNVDDDRNGYIDDVFGWNFMGPYFERGVSNNNVSEGIVDAGTYFAGIIGAIRNNEKGIDGIVENVKLMTLRAYQKGDSENMEFIKAMQYAIDNGAKVICIPVIRQFKSWGGAIDSVLLDAERKNVLIVEAAVNGGNMDENNRYLHHKTSTLLVVGSSGPSDEVLFDLNNNGGYGMKIDVLAPSLNLYSTRKVPRVSENKIADSNDSCGCKTGECGVIYYNNTNAAAAVTSGVAAFILSYYPGITARQLKSIIEASVVRIPESLTTKIDDEEFPIKNVCRTGGIVNAYNAIKLASTIMEEKK